MNFEKKDEVRIMPEFIEYYESLGLSNFYKESDDIVYKDSDCKLGRITVIQNDVAQVDFWNSVPSKFTIKLDHLILVTKASDRPQVAADPIGPVKENKADAETLRRAGIVERRNFVEAQQVTSDFLDKHVNSQPKKYNEGKPRTDLISGEFTLALGKALAYGANKYDEKKGHTPNYLKGRGFLYSDLIGALERHLAKFKMGINEDEDSSLEHIVQVAVNAMFLYNYRVSGKGIDDRIVLKELKNEI